MKQKELQEYKKKSIPEIEKTIRELSDKKMKLAFDLTGGKQNAAERKRVRSSIAQLKTVVREKIAKND